MKHKLQLFLVLMVLSTSSHAQTRQPGDPWWFEVEAILFTRDVTVEQIREQFAERTEHHDYQSHASFIESLLAPNIQMLRQALPSCEQSPHEVSLPLQTAPAPIISEALLQNDLQSYRASLTERAALLGNLGIFDDENASAEPDSLIFENEFAGDSSPVNVVSAKELGADLSLTNDSNNLEDTSSVENEKSVPSDVTVIAGHTPMSLTSEPQHQLTTLPTNLYCQWSGEETLLGVLDDIGKMSSQSFLGEPNDKVLIDQVPKVLDGYEIPFSDVPYILPANKLELSHIYKKIQAQSGLNPMLHMAWRQNVATGRENAPFYYVFAGQKAASITQNDGPADKTSASVPKQPLEIIEYTLSEDFKKRVNEELDDNIMPPWPLEGKMKLFIEYLGATPYLHVVSHFDIAVNSDNQEQSKVIRFSQLRRMISSEIHYFDHPAFGMVLQIRRYQRPTKEEIESFD